jgi:hypothetical protein
VGLHRSPPCRPRRSRYAAHPARSSEAKGDNRPVDRPDARTTSAPGGQGCSPCHADPDSRVRPHLPDLRDGVSGGHLLSGLEGGGGSINVRCRAADGERTSWAPVGWWGAYRGTGAGAARGMRVGPDAGARPRRRAAIVSRWLASSPCGAGSHRLPPRTG